MPISSHHLAIVLPGSGYGPDGPVLLLPALALEQGGATVVRVTWPDWRPSAWAPADLAPFIDEVGPRVRAAIDGVAAPNGGWRRVTWVAKSLGTLVLSLLDTTDLVGGTEQRALWLTPLLGCGNPALDPATQERLREAAPAQRSGVIDKAWPSLLVAGGADPYHDPDGHREVVDAIGADSLVVEGADHSLHVDGDVLATADGFRRLAAAVLAFDRR